MTKNSLIEMVEKAAKMRDNAPLPRNYIVDALKEIEENKKEVERYPGGQPTLKGIYDIALGLYKVNQKTN